MEQRISLFDGEGHEHPFGAREWLTDFARIPYYKRPPTVAPHDGQWITVDGGGNWHVNVDATTGIITWTVEWTNA